VLAAAALAASCAAQAQFAGTLGAASVDRYRGMGTGDAGPVVRASAMLDLPVGAYGGQVAIAGDRACLEEALAALRTAAT